MYNVHTSNRGWLSPPSPVRHLRPAVTVTGDASLADNTYRLYYGDTPIDRVRPIGEHSVSEIRKRIAAYEEGRPARADEVAPAVEPDGTGQMRLAMPEGGQITWQL